MSKSETLKQLAAASNEARLESLNRQIETLREAKFRSAEELAAVIEPLAQAMAALTDETRASLELVERRSKEQIEQSRTRVEEAVTQWTSAATAAKQAAQRLEMAGQSMEFSHYLLATLVGLVTGLLVSALLLWLGPAPVINNVLDAREVAALLKPGTAPPKPRNDR